MISSIATTLYDISTSIPSSTSDGTFGLWVKIRADTTSTTMSYLTSTPYTYRIGSDSSNYYEWDFTKNDNWRDNEWQYLTGHMSTISTTVGTVNHSSIAYRYFSINTSPSSGITTLDYILRLNGVSPSTAIGPNYIGDRRVVNNTTTIYTDI